MVGEDILGSAPVRVSTSTRVQGGRARGPIRVIPAARSRPDPWVSAPVSVLPRCAPVSPVPAPPEMTDGDQPFRSQTSRLARAGEFSVEYRGVFASGANRPQGATAESGCSVSFQNGGVNASAMRRIWSR